MAIIWSRERSKTQPLGTTNIWWFQQTGTAEHGVAPEIDETAHSWSSSLGSEQQTTCDMEVPNFRSRIARGEVINNPFQTWKTTDKYSPAQPMHYVTYDSRTGQRIWCSECNAYHDRMTVMSGNWRHTDISNVASLPSGVVVSDVEDDVASRATTSAFANIDTSEMLALATAAESRKSVESAAAILARAYRILRNVKRLNFRRLRKELTPRELSDRYMEARYAIRPLVYDLHGVAAALQKERGYERRTFRGYAEDRKYGEATTEVDSGPIIDEWLHTKELVVSARAGVLCDVSISDISVFGIDQIAETVWELVPWSFVADWFINTGDWIAAHTPNAGVTQRASWVTVRRVLTSTQSVTGHRWDLEEGITGGDLTRPLSRFSREELFLDRRINPSISTWPSSKLRLDGYKLADLGIMLRRLF